MIDDEKELFREYVADVVPIKSREVILDTKKPRPVPRQKQIDEQNVLDEMMDAPLDYASIETGEELVFSRPGFQKKPLKKLRKGQYIIEATLDLHGMIAAVAKQELIQFLRMCHARQFRCVKIIHGKGLGSKDGKPVIKTKLNSWLRQREDTLAFCSALPKDGGTGAIYLLLRKHQPRA
jgi:DNA-nicking Smr family endonuclease